MLKNLAAILATGEGTAVQALKLYAEAAMLDDGDIVLWNRMGTLVCAEPVRRNCCSPRALIHDPQT